MRGTGTASTPAHDRVPNNGVRCVREHDTCKASQSQVPGRKQLCRGITERPQPRVRPAQRLAQRIENLNEHSHLHLFLRRIGGGRVNIIPCGGTMQLVPVLALPLYATAVAVCRLPPTLILSVRSGLVYSHAYCHEAPQSLSSTTSLSIPTVP